MTFCPEWVNGSKNLVTDNGLYLWVYLFFFNMIWVIIPFALMYHTWVDIRENGIAPTVHYRPIILSDLNKNQSSADKDGHVGRYNLRSRKEQ